MARKLLAGVVVGLVLLLTACGPSGRIEEDDSRWDCTVMGNGVCGAGVAA